MKNISGSLIAIFIYILTTSCTSSSKEEMAFINVNLIPMTEDIVIENQTVLVDGDQIVAIGSSDEIHLSPDTQVVDGEGAFLMPGLADMHMHVSDAWLTDDWPANPLSLYLANGVTTIRDFETCGDNIALQLRDEIRDGKRDGPTIYSAGVIIGGQRSLQDDFNTEDAKQIIQWVKDEGYDLIKIYSYLDADKYQEVITAAKTMDMYTAGHIPFAVGLDGILEARMDEIAHIEELDWELYDFDRGLKLNPQEWDGYIFLQTFPQQAKAFDFDFKVFASQKSDIILETLEKLQGSDIPIDTTLVISEYGVEKLLQPEEHLARPEIKYLPTSYINAFQQGKTRLQQMAQMIGEENAFVDEDTNLIVFKRDMDFMWLEELKKAGIPLLLATDGGCGILGIVPGFSIHRELQILVDNGFTPYEAISTGTVNAAMVINKMTGNGDFGTIEVGKRADLVLVNGNPLEDVSNIRNILGVMAAGRWYSTESLDQMISIKE